MPLATFSGRKVAPAAACCRPEVGAEEDETLRGVPAAATAAPTPDPDPACDPCPPALPLLLLLGRSALPLLLTGRLLLLPLLPLRPPLPPLLLLAAAAPRSLALPWAEVG